MWVPPSKHAISATVDLSSTRTVADVDRLAAYADDFSGGGDIDDHDNDLEIENSAF